MSARDQILALKQGMDRSIIGQEQVVERLLQALLANGYMLLEGGKGSFQFQPGPIFGNLILADEINRAPAKVQAALLEVMEERQVTVAGTTHRLPPLFMVLATQSPIEQEGTYPLPEAQMGRFLLHVVIRYPDDAAELEVMRLVRGEEGERPGPAAAPTVIPQQAVFAARTEMQHVAMAETVERYIVALISATQRPGQFSADLQHWIHVGASPRGAMALDKV